MSVGFGFSAGDFIAALKLTSDVIDALRESGESSDQYRRLLSHLLDLETALIHVRRLELDEAQTDQQNALKRSASQCRTTIDKFMSKIQKYQPHLQLKDLSSSSVVKRSWYKIKWALCRKEDVDKFKADIAGHTEAINILLSAIGIERMNIEAKSNTDRHQSLKSIVHDCFTKTMHKLSVISDSIATTISNSKELLQVTGQTAQMDCKIFGIVLDIQDLLRRTVAPQVLRSQPVYFVDVLGISAPFHLEFIRSKEAFLAVLQSNMKGNDSAIERITKGEFAITDVATKHDLDLSRPWQVCFRPGQQVDMSMILTEQHASGSTCPSCKTACSGDTDKDMQCMFCGLTFRRLTEVDDSEPSLQQAQLAVQNTFSNNQAQESPDDFGPESSSKKRKREDDLAHELTMYRKVRLRRQQAPVKSCK